MKIGLSYSRCVRDIVDQQVNINDVLVVIARTNFDPLDDGQWQDIWGGYGGGHTVGGVWTNPEWNGYGPEREKEFRSITIELLESGKLFQPRQHGAHPRRLPYHWLDTVLPPKELERNPAVKSAWEQFRIVAGLSGIELNRDHI